MVHDYLIRVSINFCLLLKRGSSEWCDLRSVAEPGQNKRKEREVWSTGKSINRLGSQEVNG